MEPSCPGIVGRTMKTMPFSQSLFGAELYGLLQSTHYNKLLLTQKDEGLT